MNNDGTLDLVVSEGEQAHNSGPDFNQDFDKRGSPSSTTTATASLLRRSIATTGGHNQAVADVTGNGDLAILSANHGYYGAPTPLELWIRRQR